MKRLSPLIASKIEAIRLANEAINLLLDTGKGKFLGGLTSRKYVSACKTSRATAFREISDLLDKKVLVKNPTKGRNVSYDLNWEVINPAS